MDNLLSLRQQNPTNTAADWSELNVVLFLNEIAFESDTGLYKIGDGYRPWNSLPYAYDSNKITAGRGVSIDSNEISTLLLYDEVIIPTGFSLGTARLAYNALGGN